MNDLCVAFLSDHRKLITKAMVFSMIVRSLIKYSEQSMHGFCKCFEKKYMNKKFTYYSKVKEQIAHILQKCETFLYIGFVFLTCF